MISGEFIKRSIVGVLTLGGATLFKVESHSADTPVSPAQSLRLGPQTSQPIGHYYFCQDNPNECSGIFGDVPRATLTASLWKFIADIDMKFNKQISAMSDAQQWGKAEVWSYAESNAGDCEDYALEKRRALLGQIHPANLLLTVVTKPDGEGHAVLTVRTDKGDFFLDNLKAPMSVDQSDYKVLKTVDPKNEGSWVRVEGWEKISGDDRSTAVAESLKPDLF